MATHYNSKRKNYMKDLADELAKAEAEQEWWSTPRGNYSSGQPAPPPPTAPKSLFATLLDKFRLYGR